MRDILNQDEERGPVSATRPGVSAALPGRAEFEAEERARLAPWAEKSGDSRGRLHPEPEHAYRTRFARDRDRIVHSRAFRRLEYKTQVFVYHEGDHYRNRLTHTIEGAQIARTLARALRLNEDLAEAVALAHDLGHTPFGHAGEHVLDELLAGDGGFDHNRQTLRIVDWLEERYPGFRGLNLTHETREGILKHGSDWPHPVPVPALLASPSLEAQVADHADEIAYLNHDLDDGLRSGLLGWEQLEAVTALGRRARGARADRRRRLRARAARAADRRAARPPRDRSRRARRRRAIAETRVAKRRRRSAAARIRWCASRADSLRCSASSRSSSTTSCTTTHACSRRPAAPSRRSATSIATTAREPARCRRTWWRASAEEGEARAIADYIAGMTDRFALAEHEKLRA